MMRTHQTVSLQIIDHIARVKRLASEVKGFNSSWLTLES